MGGDKVGNATNKSSATNVQTNDVNPFLTAPVPKSKQEAVENHHSAKGAKEHATQMKEHKKMEASLRQAEVQQDYSNWFNDADQLKSNEKPISDPRFNEDAERSNTKKGGRLVDYTIGPYSHEKPNRPMTVTVHGVANSPEGVKPLSDRAEKAGDKVKTFMYDDTGARLAKSSHDLAKSLEKQLKENPDRPLRIDAHSMGGRVALAAVDELNRKGLLKGRKVELNLVASAINGDSRGTAALVAAKSPILGPALAEAPYIKSGQDMSSHSAFQDRLDDIKFPPNVKVRVFTGGEDSNVDRDEKFEAMCKQLHAERVHFPKADHDTAVDDAAKWLSKHDRS
jgi:pimeloyl-ACP methyl ester carboxylesterase